MLINGHLVRPQRKWYQFMLDIAWPELMVIGIVAVVAIGPKDLPKVMNQMGRWAGKARAMVQDVQRSMEQLHYESSIAERMQSNEPQQTSATATPVATPPAAHGKHHPVTAPVAPAQHDDPNDHLGST